MSSSPLIGRRASCLMPKTGSGDVPVVEGVIQAVSSSGPWHILLLDDAGKLHDVHFSYVTVIEHPNRAAHPPANHGPVAKW